MEFALQAFSSFAVVFAIGLLVLIAAVISVIDLTQTNDTIRRNYPGIGGFQHLFSALGEVFRQPAYGSSGKSA